MTISEIMSKDVITVTAETTLKEAAGLLAKFRVHGLPVIDDENRVVGIVTESDFFTKDSSNIFLPTFLEFIQSGKKNSLNADETFGLEKKTKVSDIMTTECLSVGPDFSIKKVIDIYKEKNFNSLPVVNHENKLLGIVSIMDVIKLF